MTISLTELRANLYKLFDSVLETGQPIEVKRNGHTFRISVVPPASKLDALVDRPDLIVGDPEDLVSIDWSSEWKPE
ncbi:MAG: type II toxin-antitoxin system Phd/YefM family antitoxin [Actinomycetes bacterium]